MSDERVEIKLWNWVFDNCGCLYILSERAYSAFITAAGNDYNDYQLDEHSAKIKLADRLSSTERVIAWYRQKMKL